jgi:phosphoribosylaminoimidazolecarboxamide formyltransferase/IMP cyclohydrolase
MVIKMAGKTKRALLSVSDKTGILELATALNAAGYELVSTGGTATLLSDNGLPVTAIEEVTGFPECMDGRLKTLHPGIFGGLLAVLDNEEHRHTMAAQNIDAIDILVVNLYPFRNTVENPHTLDGAIEQIDIGGPSMIRAAAKNHKYVTVVTNPADYDELTRRIAENTLDEAYRFRMAASAFGYTAAYDAYIAEYLRAIAAPDSFPDTLTITFDKHDTPMRYGENPHQQAAYYAWPQQNYNGIEAARLLHGKPLSFNNIADAYAALALAKEFDTPICVAVKHATPCGVATGATILDAYTAAYQCDPQSIFGGIVCVNREVDEATAQMMHDIFLEVIIAPSYSDTALKILTKKKNLRLLALPALAQKPAVVWECKSVGGGLLVQESDATDIADENRTVVTEKAPEKLDDLLFAMKVVKHVKSNAIVVVKDGCTVGIGGGEVSRVWAAEAALARAGEAAKGAVLASDALFPFPDVVELCANYGVTEIIQPGGSIKDQLSIDSANAHGIAMVFTGVRHFKH